MKKLIIVAVAVAILGGFGLYGGKVTEFLKNETVVVNNNVPETVTKTERVDNLEVLIEEAQDEARTKIEADAEVAYEKEVAEAKATQDKYIADELVKVSDKVKEDYIAEIEATISTASY